MQPQNRAPNGWIGFAILIFFVLLALASTWPLPLHWSDRIPIGSEPARTVPYFNLWTMEWNIKSLAWGSWLYGDQYWNAGIFFPTLNALAMSEAQPATIIVAPIYWLTNSAALSFNCYLWLMLSLNGWMTWRVLARRGFPMLIAIGSGVAMELLPIVHWQSGVLQLVPVWGIVWFLDELARFARLTGPALWSQATEAEPAEVVEGSDAFARGVGLAAGLTATCWTCVHHAVMLIPICLLAILPFGKSFFCKRGMISVVVCSLILFATVGPIIWRHYLVNQEHGFAREAEIVQRLSATLTDYSSVVGHTWLNAQLDQQREWHLSPGWIKTVLAAGGLLLAVVKFRQQSWLIFMGLVASLALLLSLGTNLQVGNRDVWTGLAHYVPGFAQVRSVYRFAYFFQIASVFLAAGAVGWLWQLVQTAPPAKRSTTGLRTLLFGLLLWAALDPWPQAMRMAVLPSRIQDSPSLQLLSEAPLAGTIILPISNGGNVRDYEATTEWMLQSLEYYKPLVNGYSGFFPKQHLDIARQWSENGFDRNLQAKLFKLGVRYVLVFPHYTSHQRDDWSTPQLMSEHADPIKLYVLRNPSEF